MGRRVWTIAEKDKVEQSDIDDARANNCPEIVNGIPPALFGVVLEADLPTAYEEPESVEPEPIPPFEPPSGTSTPERISYIEDFLLGLYG